MSHETTQLDMPVHQLVINSPPSVWTEIGEAQITHTIFGKAKVRIVRKHDNLRRALWWAAIAAVAVAIALWQGWFALLQTEPQSEEAPPSVSAKEAVSELPSMQPENIVAPAIPPAAVKEPGSPPHHLTNKPVPIQKSVLEQTIDSKGSEQNTAQGVTAQTRPAVEPPRHAAVPAVPVAPPQKSVVAGTALVSKPQAAPLSTSNAAIPATEKQTIPASRIAVPTPVTPRVVLPAVQAVSSPAVVVTPLAAPLVKEDAQAPAADKQVPSPANVGK